MTIYKAVLKGHAWGQSIVNTLWYELGVGIDVDGLTLSGADVLARCIKDQVWSKLKGVHTSDYALDEIIVYPMHSGSFDLVYQNPYTLFVSEAGTNSANTDGVGICVNFNFNLEPTTILDGIKPPKRGYIAVGPINSSWIANSGAIEQSFLNDPIGPLKQAADALGQNLESLLPPAIYYPIRVSQTKVLGVWRVLSKAGVSSCTPRLLTSFRRSRMLKN